MVEGREPLANKKVSGLGFYAKLPLWELTCKEKNSILRAFLGTPQEPKDILFSYTS